MSGTRNINAVVVVRRNTSSSSISDDSKIGSNGGLFHLLTLCLCWQSFGLFWRLRRPLLDLFYQRSSSFMINKIETSSRSLEVDLLRRPYYRSPSTSGASKSK